MSAAIVGAGDTARKLLPPEVQAAQRAIVGGEADAFGQVWAEMPEAKRRFWLHYSRLLERYSTYKWTAIPGDVRAILKNNLYRGAVELQSLLKALQ